MEGAHTKCRLLAEKAGLDNSASFMAWLSDALHSPAKDFTLTDNIPYVRPDGVRVADDWNDLVQNGPHDGIFVTEKPGRAGCSSIRPRIAKIGRPSILT